MIHSYPFYIADWRESETRLAMNCEERGLYWELLHYCWWEGSLPTDLNALRVIAGVTEREFKRSWPKCKPHFSQKDGRYHHAKVDAGRPKLEQWRESRREAGRSGGKAKAIAKADATANAKHEGVAQPKPPSSSSSSSSSSVSSSTSDSSATHARPSTDPLTLDEWKGFSLDDGFEEFKAVYPAHRLSRVSLCQRLFCDAFLGIQEGTEVSYLATILAPLKPGGTWAESEDWSKGFICSAEDYLRFKRWGESPKQKAEPKKSLLERMAAGEDPDAM
ncbi:MAG: DUF1376 domain-containing protein [Paludibaculum sp.]